MTEATLTARPKNVSRVLGLITFAALSLTAIAPSHAAAVLSPNDNPATVLDDMTTSVGKMDGIAAIAAGLGIATTVFGGTALILKRFIYS